MTPERRAELAKICRQLAQCRLLVEDGRHDEPVDDGNGSGLGRREPAKQDAAHDNHGNEQRRQRFAQHGHELGQRRRRLPGIVALAGDDEDRHGHAGADQEARNDAGREHGGHRLVRHPGVDDGDDRRRDDGCDDGSGDGKRRGEIEVVALAHHLRDQEGAERRHVGHRRARDAAEEHAVDDVDVGEAAAEAADHGRGKIDDDARDSAAGGDVAGENEQRRREQQIGVGQQADEAGRDDDRIERGVEEGRNQRAHAQRDADRLAEQDEDKKGDQEDFGHIVLSAK